jgi:3-oxoacyl-(acyl-carrier-protein) synthase III
MVMLQNSPPTSPLPLIGTMSLVGDMAVMGTTPLVDDLRTDDLRTDDLIDDEVVLGPDPVGAAVTGVSLLGLGAYVPSRVVTNAEVGTPAGVDAAWIEAKTGIHQRRWAGVGEATSDLAAAAGRRALADAGIRPDQLTLLVVATSTPDQSQPPTAAFVQRALGASNAAVFDVNAVCSGFTFALGVISQMVAATGGLALVIGADVYSRILNPRDRRTVILFGDGAGAAIVGQSASHDGHRVLATSLHSFGDLSDMIGVPAGGSRLPFGPDVDDDLRFFTMDGRGVRAFVTDRLPSMIGSFLAKNGLRTEDVQHFVPHQANGMMLRDLIASLAMPNAHTHLTVEHLGNTGSASIPITLEAAQGSGLIGRGDLVLLAGFGGGMAVGLTLVRW